MAFTYIQTEDALWTTGHRDPSGAWHPDRDCGSPEYAAARTAWLNGSGENPGTEHEWLQRQAEQRTVQATADPDLLTEISNLRQENVELHELIAVQRETIDRLQRELRRERISAMQAAGACALIRAIYSTRTRTHQTLVRVGGGA